jgi:hypothetical protein
MSRAKSLYPKTPECLLVLYDSRYPEADSREILPMLREPFSRRPEAPYLGAWELQSLLFSVRYANGLLNEGDIAALEVARTDFDPEAGAA